MTERHSAREYLETVVFAYDGNECLAWPFSKDDNGYGRVKIAGSSRSVSRVVCEKTHGPPPSPGHQAAHSCGNGHLACSTKAHLSWKTALGNSIDKIEHGSRKLTPDDVLMIRLMARVISMRAVGEKYGVNAVTVHQIVHRKTWAWVTDTYDHAESLNMAATAARHPNSLLDSLPTAANSAGLNPLPASRSLSQAGAS